MIFSPGVDPGHREKSENPELVSLFLKSWLFPAHNWLLDPKHDLCGPGILTGVVFHDSVWLSIGHIETMQIRHGLAVGRKGNLNVLPKSLHMTKHRIRSDQENNSVHLTSFLLQILVMCLNVCMCTHTHTYTLVWIFCSSLFMSLAGWIQSHVSIYS